MNMEYEKEIRKILEDCGIEVRRIEIPPDPKLGDFSFPCFELAKKFKKEPQEVAKEICKKIKLNKKFLKVEANSGYVNFFLNWNEISKEVLSDVQKIKVNVGNGSKVMVEYVSANPIHPLHVGSLRNALIGSSLVKILEKTNHKVISHFYVNDMGLQVAKLVYGFLNFPEKKLEEKADHWLGKIYAITDRFIENDKEVLKELKNKWPDVFEKLIRNLEKKEDIKGDLKDLIKRCESGDLKTVKKFKRIAKICIRGFKKTLNEIGIKFDSFDFESDFVIDGSVHRVVEKLKEKGMLKRSEENTLVLDLGKFNLPSLVLVRSDGTTLYVTRDIAYSIWKFEKFGVEKVINIIGIEQSLAQSQLRAALKLLGYEKESENLIHLAYNHVRLPGIKMSGRRGRYLTIDELIEISFKKALSEVEKRGTSEKNKYKIAREIAIGAIKYAILKVEPEKEITFDIEKAIRFEGDTGPYIQYAYTRCSSIMRKARKIEGIEVKNITENEKELIKKISEFPKVLENASRELRPHYICNYAYELATRFDRFYEFCPVLKAENEIRNFRLALVDLTRKILKNCLELLGIKPLEKM
ncbi:MAG: arginine--tRNA ligase [Candidatus Aenigmatarchaeota archaeon]